jgi:sensor histidine kinase regulating citrate/malate metabolism
MKKLSLWAVLSFSFIATLVLSVSISYGLVIKNAANRVRQNEEKLLLATGKQLASETLVIESLQKNETNESLQHYTNELRIRFYCSNGYERY